ncbi:MAG: flagellar export protein FliJ [Kiritimatiellae bacterium]|nr:flagellar export protein FliJ [Kiritimatiellia bacterium]
MKRFAFSLQEVLETKETLEDAVRVRLAGAFERLRISREALLRLKALLDGESRRIEGLSGHDTDQHELFVHLRYRRLLGSRIKKQTRIVLTDEVEVNRLREELRAVMTERKSLEHLRDIEWQRWLLAQRRLEQKQMDEISAQRYVRGAAEQGVHH